MGLGDWTPEQRARVHWLIVHKQTGGAPRAALLDGAGEELYDFGDIVNDDPAVSFKLAAGALQIADFNVLEPPLRIEGGAGSALQRWGSELVGLVKDRRQQG